MILDAGQNDSPDGQSGRLSWQEQPYGLQRSELAIQVPYPTVYRIAATGTLTKRLVPETIEYVAPVTYGPNGRMAISWMYGSTNNTVTVNDTTYILVLAPSRIYQIAQSGLGNENIYGTLTRTDGSPLYCGPQYGSFCFEYVGEPSDYVLTRPIAEVTLSVDSNTVSSGSTVTFKLTARPDSVGPYTTPISVDSVAWLPDPDTSGGDYSEKKVWGACVFSNRQCTRQIVGSGTLKVTAHVNGARILATAHVGTRDQLRLRAVKAFISRGDSVTFAPSMSDGSNFIPYGWSWKADSVTSGQTAVCPWQTSPCRTRVWEHGWMTITVYKNGVQRKARAHVTVGPRPRLELIAAPTVADSGNAIEFVTSAAGADYSVLSWTYSSQGGTQSVPCADQKICRWTPPVTGTMQVSGVVDGEPDAAVAAVEITADSSASCDSSTSAFRSSATQAAAETTSNCEEPPPLEDVGEENGEDCADLPIDLSSSVSRVQTYAGLAVVAQPPYLGATEELADDADRAYGGLWPDEESIEPCVLFEGCWREVTREESDSILAAARSSGDWYYTQGGARGGKEPAKNMRTKYGDCTDYVWNAARQALGASWPHPWYLRPGTSNFRTWSTTALLEAGYIRINATQARPGDTVVRGGHAGIYTGTDAYGRVMGIANNGVPATPERKGVNKETGPFDFSAQGEWTPQFYRPIVTIECEQPPPGM